MITIELTKMILAPVEEVSVVLLEHKKLDRFFNANFTLIKPENPGELIGGKGAIRQVSIGKIVFNEEIIEASQRHIYYRIVGNKPISDHQGHIQLNALKNQESHTQVNYRIQFNVPKILPAFLVKYFVSRDVKKAMKRLAKYFVGKNFTAKEKV